MQLFLISWVSFSLNSSSVFLWLLDPGYLKNIGQSFCRMALDLGLFGVSSWWSYVSVGVSHAMCIRNIRCSVIRQHTCFGCSNLCWTIFSYRHAPQPRCSPEIPRQSTSLRGCPLQTRQSPALFTRLFFYKNSLLTPCGLWNPMLGCPPSSTRLGFNTLH